MVYRIMAANTFLFTTVLLMNNRFHRLVKINNKLYDPYKHSKVLF